MTIEQSRNIEDLSKHMVIGFPTADKDDVFIETLSDEQIRPRVGKPYNGKKVVGIYIMRITWIPLDGSPELESSFKIE